MYTRIKEQIKRVIPTSIKQQYWRYGREADKAKEMEFRREFFWSAFKALDFNGIDGDYVEFGCCGGNTFSLAYKQIQQRKMQRHMWAFDSFEGLPDASSPLDNHPKWKKGALTTGLDKFHKICHTQGIPRDAYSVVQGYYDDALTSLADDAAPANIALAYIDCDMYSSTKTVLEFLRPRLKHGMILAFDDYFCWSSDQISGERKALLDEFDNDKKWNFLQYKGIAWAGSSFIVERADLVHCLVGGNSITNARSESTAS